MRDDGSPDDAVQISRRVIIPPPPGVEVTNTREVGILLNPDEDNPGKFTASITGLSEGEREAVRALLKLREADPAGAREMEAKIPDLVRLVDGARKDAAALIYRLRHFPAGAAMAAWTAAKTLSGPDPHKILHEVARWALAKFTDTDDALAGDARENAELRDPYVRTLHEHVVNALKAAGVGVGGHPETDEDAAQLHGEPGREILIQDARFADYLEGLGEEGAANAESVRKSGRERAEMFNHPQLERDPDGEVYENRGELWGLWVDVGPSDRPGFLFLRYLAVVVWKDVVQAKLERARRTPPALPFPIFDQLARVSVPGGRQEGDRLVTRNGQAITPIQRVDAPLEGLPVATLASMAGLVSQGAGLLGSLTAHRLYRWAPIEARRRYLDGDPDPRVLAAEGWQGLADAIGATTNKARGELPAIVAAGAHLCFPFPPDSIGNLWSWRYTRAAGQKAGRVELTLSTTLLPHFGKDTRAKLNRFDRKLVPVLPLPPMVGRPRDWGALAALQLVVLAELRRMARDLVKPGGAMLDWPKLADAAGVSSGMLPRVLERWIHDGDDGPAFLKRVGRNRYTLADREAREFIERAGQRELDGAKRPGPKRRRKK